MDINDKLIQQLIGRLDFLLSVKLNPLNDKSTDQDKIQRFDSFGFTPAEIALILGSTSDRVSKQLYIIRNKKKEGK